MTLGYFVALTKILVALVDADWRSRQAGSISRQYPAICSPSSSRLYFSRGFDRGAHLAQTSATKHELHGCCFVTRQLEGRPRKAILMKTVLRHSSSSKLWCLIASLVLQMPKHEKGCWEARTFDKQTDWRASLKRFKRAFKAFSISKNAGVAVSMTRVHHACMSWTLAAASCCRCFSVFHAPMHTPGTRLPGASLTWHMYYVLVSRVLDFLFDFRLERISWKHLSCWRKDVLQHMVDCTLLW